MNEFFAEKKISDESLKDVADNNLLSAFENSSFTLKDKIDFFNEKWQKDHVFELVMIMLLII